MYLKNYKVSKSRNKGFPYFYLSVPAEGNEEARLMKLF